MVRIVKSIIENRHKFKGAMALSSVIGYSCIGIYIAFLVLLGAFSLNKVISLLLQKIKKSWMYSKYMLLINQGYSILFVPFVNFIF